MVCECQQNRRDLTEAVRIRDEALETLRKERCDPKMYGQDRIDAINRQVADGKAKNALRLSRKLLDEVNYCFGRGGIYVLGRV